MSDGHTGKDVAEVVIGATSELLNQGGKYVSAQNHHGMAKGGELLVKGASRIAPGAVAAAASALTVAVPVVAPVVIAAGVGYAAWCLGKWIYDEFA